MSHDGRNTRKTKRATPSRRLRDHWTPQMRKAFAQGRQPRDNTAQLGRPSDADDRTLRRIHQVAAAMVIGAPLALLMTAVAIRALSSG